MVARERGIASIGVFDIDVQVFHSGVDVYLQLNIHDPKQVILFLACQFKWQLPGFNQKIFKP